MRGGRRLSPKGNLLSAKSTVEQSWCFHYPSLRRSEATAAIQKVAVTLEDWIATLRSWVAKWRLMEVSELFAPQTRLGPSPGLSHRGRGVSLERRYFTASTAAKIVLFCGRTL